MLGHQVLGQGDILFLRLVRRHSLFGGPGVPFSLSLEVHHPWPIHVHVPYGSLLVESVDLLHFILAQGLVHFQAHLIGCGLESLGEGHDVDKDSGGGQMANEEMCVQGIYRLSMI
eukprot:TRINITY_DN1073_c0_g1_i1.p1 TRINITY_DN1073_c0_g1~~TRINITY_DN1073_c0_g1_i1.p1  ORF type:complete len:115 (+),score=14.02 TRINITY_DN1073_c0_g1_i1:206-550(+)